MDGVRYYLALITLMSLVPALLLWFLIHPFGAFWRKLHPWVTLFIFGLFTVLAMVPVFLLRHRLLRWDLGTNYGTLLFGFVALALGSVVAMRRKRHLTYRILSGLPEFSAKDFPGTLLTEGIYGSIRHPRYVEVALWVLGYALIANFPALYGGFLLTVPALLLIVVLEERELEERFGDAWRDYAARVPRFVPRRLR